MNKRLLGLLVVSVAIGASALFITQRQPDLILTTVLDNQIQATHPSQSQRASTVLPEQVATVTMPVALANPGSVSDMSTAAPRSTWLPIQGAIDPFPVASRVKEKLTIDLSSVDLGAVQSGDRMSFSLPDGSEAIARVENTWTESNGDKVWSGHVEDPAGTDYRIIVTQGASATFASINTSKGSYSMESINGRGVVYKNPEMGDVASHGTSDYLIPGT